MNRTQKTNLLRTVTLKWLRGNQMRVGLALQLDHFLEWFEIRE